MKNWLAQHVQATSSSLRRFAAAPLSTLLNVLVIGIALSLPAGLYALLQNAQQFVDHATRAPQISVFLNLSASKADIEQIGQRLKQNPAVDHADFVPRDAALEQIKKTTGMADVIGGLAQNPLPDAYIVYPRQTDAQALEVLRDEMQKWPRVELAQLDSGWARKLDALLQFGRTVVLLLVALLGFALLAVTF
ncbi:MAG: permease-like cell division protein FtsX, partial [Gallionellaceae bacterium]|nr:permease-like cell division protein FtsX [Gallionellaceae bacterium]